MDPRIDADSPVPLYHQIAEMIRYRISTGAIRAGELLPALRAGAETWGVNLHTVRRAYAELAETGLVRIDRPQGAVVLDAGPTKRRARADTKLKRFVNRVLNQARDDHGLSPLELARLLTLRPGSGGTHRVAVVECSETQCADLADQLERQWVVTADPWCLSHSDDLPESEIVATYFHYNDIRRRWPKRLGDVHFVAIRPDPLIVNRVSARCRDGRPREIHVCEHDPMMLSMIMADLSGLFESGAYALLPQVVEDTRWLLPRGDASLVLVSPRMWGSLSPQQRSDSRVMEIRYVFDGEEIERLAAELNWSVRRRIAEGTADQAG